MRERGWKRIQSFVKRRLRWQDTGGAEDRAERTVEVSKEEDIEESLGPPEQWLKGLFLRETFHKAKAPEVTILIPAYNHYRTTMACLEALSLHTDGAVCEVLLADDGSEDETAQLPKAWRSFRRLPGGPGPVGFLKNVNRGAKEARGTYLVLLNNDTQVQAGWLLPLLQVFRKRKDAGIAGPLLLDAQGRVSEAGGIVWQDGSAWNYGRGEDPQRPEVQFFRETDYVSGACLMIPRALWKKAGGFDPAYAPAYYEDTDLAFRVRRMGYGVYYQPLSQVIHEEGVSCGTDEETDGIKRWQKINQEIFVCRHQEELGRFHFPNGQEVQKARDRSRLKQSILVIDHYVPEYDRDAGSRCCYLWLKLFVRLGLRVTFLGDNFHPTQPYTGELNQLGIEVLCGNWHQAHWQEWMKENLSSYTYVYLQRPHIAGKYLPFVQTWSKARVFYFAHDLHFLRLQRQYKVTGETACRQEAEVLRKQEEALFRAADVIHVVGHAEKACLSKLFPEKKIRNIPVFQYDTLPKRRLPFSETRDLLFIGGFAHPPNEDGILWFLIEVFPRLRKSLPGLCLHIAGSKPGPRVLAQEAEDVHVHGWVTEEALAGLYQGCRLCVAPLRFGAGVKGKVVEAASYGLPVVTTACGAEGIPDLGSYVIAETGEEMAQRITTLYQDMAELEKMSLAGRALIRRFYTPEVAERVFQKDMIRSDRRWKDEDPDPLRRNQ